MSNIVKIMKHDLRKVTGSVVAIIIIMGLCIVPCLYAWFNIFSNWSPYEAEATGRIRVSVASNDPGVDVMGLYINVGDKIIEALEANDSIGWTFPESSEAAIESVRAGDCYAALIIPDGFSEDVMSFIGGDLTNPRLIYYENEKKNAIAPKITGKAEAAVREQVNSTFVETLMGYVSDGASVVKATGADPQEILTDLSGKVEALSDKLDSCIVITKAAASLSDSAHNLLSTSDVMIGSTQSMIGQSKRIADSASDSLDKISYLGQEEQEDAANQTDDILEALDKMTTMIGRVIDGRISYAVFVKLHVPDLQKDASRLKTDADKRASQLKEAGFTALGGKFSDLADKFGEIWQDLEDMKSVDPKDIDAREQSISALQEDIDRAGEMTAGIRDYIDTLLKAKYNKALRDTRDAIRGVSRLCRTTYSDLGEVSSLLTGFDNSLADLEQSLDRTNASVQNIQDSMGTVSGVMQDASGSRLLSELSTIFANDDAAVAEYLAEPVRMNTEVIYPIREYGSAMAPFYTVLAQWVGALLTAVLIKVKIRKEGDFSGIRLHEHFFGRYGLYLFVGLAQALIVSLGDLLYIGIQCVSPVRFVLAACLNGIAFTMINYALVFALDNIGLAAGVIILVIQVAGSGGTYPVEVLPKVFQVLYPFMPFRYAMDAMRECVAGMYANTYAKCMGMLCVTIAISIAFGLALYYPALWLNRLIAESKEKSEIML